jgi:hypothetical protein
MKKDYALAISRLVKKYYTEEMQGLQLAMCNYGLAYSYEYKAILVPKSKDEDDYKWEDWMYSFLRDQYDLYIKTEKEMDIFSLLHEIGHHMNRKTFDSMTYKKLVDEIDEEDYMTYRELPDEQLADEWAVSFIKEHYDELIEIYNKLNL